MYFNTLVTSWDEVKEAQEIAMNSEGASAEKYDKYYESVAASIEKITVAWENFTKKLEQNGTIKTFSKLLSGIVDYLDWILMFAQNRLVLNMLNNSGNFKGFLPRVGSAAAGLFWGTKNNKWSKAIEEKYGNISKKSPEVGAIETLTGVVKDIRNEVKGASTLQNYTTGNRLVTDGNIIDAFERSQLTSDELSDRESAKKLSSGWRGAFARGFGFEKKFSVHNKDGSVIKVAKDKNGNWQNISGYGKLTDEQKAEADAQRDASRSGMGAKAAAAGVAAGLSSAMMTENKYGGEKVAAGLMSGLGGAVSTLGPAGLIIGTIMQIFGPTFGKMVGEWFHEDEVDREKRVKEAQNQLGALEKMEDSIGSLNDGIKVKVEEMTSADWKNWYDSIDNLRESFDNAINKEDYDKTKDYEAAKNAYETGFEKKLLESFDRIKKSNDSLKDTTIDVNSALDLMRNKVNGSAEALQAWTAAEIRMKADQTLRAAEQEINDIKQQIIESKDEEEIKRLRNQLENYSKERSREYMRASVYESGVANKTSGELSASSLNTIIRQVALNWEESSGEKIYGGDGQIYSSKREDIEQYLRANGYDQLFNNATVSFAERYEDLMDVTANLTKDYDELYNNAFKFESDMKEPERIAIDLANPQMLQTIADGFYMTTEGMHNLGDVANYITQSDATGSLEDFTEKIKKLSDLFVDISQNGLSSANMKTIIDNYSALLFNKNGELDVGGTQNRLLSLMSDGGFGTLYGGKFASEATSSNNYWKIFLKAYKEDAEAAGLDAYLNFDAAFLDNKLDDDLVKKFSGLMQQVAGEIDISEPIREMALKYANHILDQEINAYKDLKDAIADSNKQRELEIKFMEAQQKLENAKNEKKRVYRSGIGFTYEQDSEAIDQAQKELEEAQKQRDEENIQYQIDMLEQQKSILNNIEENKQLQNLIEMFGGELGKTGVFGQTAGYLEDITEVIQAKFGKAVGDSITEENAKAVQVEAGKAAAEKAKKAVSEYESALEDYKNADIFGQYEMKDNIEQKYKNVTDAQKELTKYSSWKNDIGENLYDSGNKKVTDYKSKELSGTFVTKQRESSNDASAYKININPLVDTEIKEGQKNYEKLVGHEVEKLRIDENGELVEDGKIYNFDDEWKNPDYNGTIVSRYSWGKRWFGYIMDGKLYGLGVGDYDENYYYNGGYGNYSDYVHNASGTFSSQAGPSYINEEGLEGIITPNGTLTSLPAKTGIIPADLTHNLYNLGEIAPNLIKRLDSESKLNYNNSTATEDNSTNIQTLNAEFKVEKDFDFNQFLMKVRQVVDTTKHSY